MENSEKIKEIVKEKYSEIALASDLQQVSCCSSSCGCDSGKVIDYTMVGDDYTQLPGYVADADLGLGCGLPTEFAGIKEGDTVLDLGSGAGNDVFIARSLTGESGRVIGLDFTQSMVNKAKINNEKLGYKNVEFHLGDIEAMPFENSFVDVVVSNCVLNLVPDKKKTFAEIFRVLKKDAHFCVSDIVIEGELPSELKKSAEMYAGCISGAIQKSDYLQLIKDAGFSEIEVKKSKPITIPVEVLAEYLDQDGINNFNKSNTGIFSITVTAIK